ncbi:phosphatase PAP2 family protein [Nibribacter ruber]|uniref:Phosphatase PAP2 family protein n=1 Tax=Nibribacter ruber TaxID=2698458 RepID=A0A6P1NWN0_9BACT|nr:phosphatase PAP2 family protein [Nibribacter ruber]QHL86041.1 phosphatase PAP2 family protein [Nibribacter ruber]
MKYLKLLCLCMCLPFFSGGALPAYAQPRQQDPGPRHVQDTLPIIGLQQDTAAAQKFAHQPRFSPALKITGLVLGSAALWTATYAWVDEPLQKFTQQHRTAPMDMLAQAVEPMGRHSLLLPVTGTVALAGFAINNPNLKKVGMVSLGSLLISGGFTGLVKNQVHRYRPSVTGENHFYDWGEEVSDNTSFPSSHTTVAFAMATSVASVYGQEHGWVSPVAYGTATLVGLSRINDNAHWATDVMAGAAVGYLSAKGAVFLYNLTEQKLKARKSRLLLAPQAGLSSASFVASLTF